LFEAGVTCEASVTSLIFRGISPSNTALWARFAPSTELLVNQIAAGEGHRAAGFRAEGAPREQPRCRLALGSPSTCTKAVCGAFASWTTARASSATTSRSPWRASPPARSRHWRTSNARGRSAFAGEALASIGAVARLAIVSRRAGDRHAWRIACEAGAVSPVEPAALAAGTTIDVEDLYFNTPARRKVLKSESTEHARCDEAFSRIALSRADVAFSLAPQRAAHAAPAAGDSGPRARRADRGRGVRRRGGRGGVAQRPHRAHGPRRRARLHAPVTRRADTST
jgi:hypothetical protein